jgi:hypothetical protein
MGLTITSMNNKLLGNINLHIERLYLYGTLHLSDATSEFPPPTSSMILNMASATVPISNRPISKNRHIGLPDVFPAAHSLTKSPRTSIYSTLVPAFS